MRALACWLGAARLSGRVGRAFVRSDKWRFSIKCECQLLYQYFDTRVNSECGEAVLMLVCRNALHTHRMVASYGEHDEAPTARHTMPRRLRVRESTVALA